MYTNVFRKLGQGVGLYNWLRSNHDYVRLYNRRALFSKIFLLASRQVVSPPEKHRGLRPTHIPVGIVGGVHEALRTDLAHYIAHHALMVGGRFEVPLQTHL